MVSLYLKVNFVVNLTSLDCPMFLSYSFPKKETAFFFLPLLVPGQYIDKTFLDLPFYPVT